MEPMENVSLPDAESTLVEDTSHAEPDPSLSDAKSTRLEERSAEEVPGPLIEHFD